MLPVVTEPNGFFPVILCTLQTSLQFCCLYLHASSHDCSLNFLFCSANSIKLEFSDGNVPDSQQISVSHESMWCHMVMPLALGILTRPQCPIEDLSHRPSPTVSAFVFTTTVWLIKNSPNSYKENKKKRRQKELTAWIPLYYRSTKNNFVDSSLQIHSQSNLRCAWQICTRML